MRSKDEVREDVWHAMEREGVARFPGAEGRIPNYAGAKGAAERLARHPAWIAATTVKANPDSPQTHARRLALEQGKVLVMAVPRLRDLHPFRLLDPRGLSPHELREAATIKGALRHGTVIDLDQVPQLDLVLSGSVAVNLKGARLGKGGGSRTRAPALRGGQDRPPHGRGHHRARPSTLMTLTIRSSTRP